MAGVRMELDGRSTLVFLEGVTDRLENGFVLFDAIGAAMVASTDRRFETQQDPDGNPWPQSVRALAEGGKTLIDTARLVQSVTHIASADGVEVGSNVPYAGVHNDGATIEYKGRQQTIYRRYDERSGEMSARFVSRKKANFAQDVDVGPYSVTFPRRQFIGLSQGDRQVIAELVQEIVFAGAEASRVQ